MSDAPRMPRLPDGVEPYRRTPEFTEETVPAGLRREHRTKAGVWGRICVRAGSLRYRILSDPPAEFVLDPDTPGIIEPEVPHEVELRPGQRVAFHVEFLRP